MSARIEKLSNGIQEGEEIFLEPGTGEHFSTSNQWSYFFGRVLVVVYCEDDNSTTHVNVFKDLPRYVLDGGVHIAKFRHLQHLLM